MYELFLNTHVCKNLQNFPTLYTETSSMIMVQKGNMQEFILI
jgi:hypothetical protein